MSNSPLREWVRAQPFVPFAVTMSSGRVVVVSGPEMILLSPRRDVVSYVDGEGHDALVIIYHDHITSVDIYDPTQTRTPANGAPPPAPPGP